MDKENGKSLVLNIHDILGGDSQSSVKLCRTTKGVTWEIKVYDGNPRKALEVADSLFDECKKKYSNGEE